MASGMAWLAGLFHDDYELVNSIFAITLKNYQKPKNWLLPSTGESGLFLFKKE